MLLGGNVFPCAYEGPVASTVLTRKAEYHGEVEA